MRARVSAVVALTAVALALGPVAPAARQGLPAVATTAEAIVGFPTYFQGRPVAVAARPIRSGGLWVIETFGPIALVIQPASGQPPLRPLEMRGTVLDPRLLAAADPRRTTLRAITDVFVPGRMPGKASMLVLTNATWLDEQAPAMTLRQIALHPLAWLDAVVTIRGRFHGRNLYDELPAAPPAAGSSSFVLQSADAAVWVTGIAPQGPGFSFDPALRFDTSRWLAVTGVVKSNNGLVWIEGTAVAETQPSPEQVPTPTAPTFRLPRPAVIFTAPVDRDDDVDPATTVRIQFSRDMREATFGEHLSVRYEGSTTMAPPFTLRYRVATRSIEMRFATPLQAGAKVIVRLSEGITALDGSPLEPTEITFSVRASAEPDKGKGQGAH